MDSKVGGLEVRPWFWGIGIVESVILGLFFIPVFGMCCDSKYCSQGKLGCVWLIALIAAAIKTFIWAIVEIVMFATIISKECSGRIYDYGLALVIIHGLYLLSVLCKCICCRDREQ